MNEKIADLILAAESNDADAQDELYESVDNRELSEGDRKQILDWLLKTARMGNAISMYGLGRFYEGNGTAKDDKSAFDWFVESAKAGYSAALYTVGMYYKDGRVVTKDYANAIDHFEKAIELCGLDGRELGEDIVEVHRDDLAWWEAVVVRSVKYPKVPFAVGNYYYMLKDPDLGQAIRFYKIAAEQGYGHSQYVLGKFYYTGEGVEIDHKLAFQWLEKAAQQEVVPAMYYLGKLYADEQSAVFDMDKAVDWWMRSRSLGDSESPGLVDLELSWCLALGVGVDQFERYEDERECEYSAVEFLLWANDEIPAREPIVVDSDSWWYRYVIRGDVQALYWLGQCYIELEQLVPPDGNDKDVCTLDCLRKAAETGHVEAQHLVAWFLCHGPRSVRDQDEGIRWYRLAAAQGHPDAIEHLEAIEATKKS